MSLLSRVFWLCYLDHYVQFFIYLVVFGFQIFCALILCGFGFKLFGFWLDYVLFVSLIGYALYFDIDLFLLHFISGLIPMYFGFLMLPKGEKNGV